MSIQFTSKKVGELLKEEDLRIPSYQRPYNFRLVLLSCMKMMDT